MRRGLLTFATIGALLAFDLVAPPGATAASFLPATAMTRDCSTAPSYNVRSQPTTAASIVTTLGKNVTVTVASPAVAGGSWSVSTCASPTSGSYWYRLISVGSTAVSGYIFSGALTTPVLQVGDTTARLGANTRWVNAEAMLESKMATLDDPSKKPGMSVFGDAYVLRINVAKKGWSDPTSQTLWTNLLLRQKPNPATSSCTPGTATSVGTCTGGWGLDDAWDAFQDGTSNPVGTSYTVTTADHIGPILIDAYLHGVTNAEHYLLDAVNSILATPRITLPSGTCVAYSNSGYDNRYCVHNVNLGAAAFLQNAQAALGRKIAGADSLIAAIKPTFDAYLNAYYLPYSTDSTNGSSGGNEDPDHNGYTLDSAAQLGIASAGPAIKQFLTTPWYVQPGVSSYPLYNFGTGFARAVPFDCNGAYYASTVEAVEAIASATGLRRGDYAHNAWAALEVIRQCLSPVNGFATTRFAGTTQYANTYQFDTAVAISKNTFAAGCGCVAYIANVTASPDSLAGAAAAGYVNGPLLYVDASGLNSITATELSRLRPTRIVVLGSSAVVSDAVFTALSAYAPVARYYGTDRYSTAASVSAHTFPANCNCVAYIAQSNAFIDALGGAAAAGKVNGPVLFVDQTGPINVDTANELVRLRPSKIVVLGSSAVVDGTVYNALAAYAPAIDRYYASDRYGTAASVSRHTFATACGCVVYAVNAYTFSDGFAAAAAAGKVKGPILLVDAVGSINQETSKEIIRLNPTKIIGVGTASVVSAQVLTSLKYPTVPLPSGN